MGVREYLQSRGGKTVTVAIFSLGVILAGYSLWSNLGVSSESADLNDPVFICSETGKSFHKKLEIGLTNPVYSPYSKKNTGYPAEYCFWTKDGKAKDSPTIVLLNRYKGLDKPTFCPDCGRLVVLHNPPAREGAKPPPTEKEYNARH